MNIFLNTAIGIFISALFVLGVLQTQNIVITTKDKVKTIMTIGYKEGQIDAQNGDIRYNTKRKCWIKSPWNSGSTNYIGSACN